MCYKYLTFASIFYRKTPYFKVSEKLVEVAISAMQNIKANKVVVIDLSPIENAICKYFVICHGNSNTHVSSIAQSVEKELKETLQEVAFRKEGYSNAQWILLDYSSVLIHVFQEQTREFYNIEDLWADAKVTVIEDK